MEPYKNPKTTATSMKKASSVTKNGVTDRKSVV